MGAINKNVSQDDLNSIIKTLMNFEKRFIEEAKAFLSIGENLYSMDLFISGIVNRSISLIDGFISLSQNNNYISAVPLIRVQLDNSLRLYAATLVDDHNVFFTRYLAGEHIRNIKDTKGKKMTDTYLAKKLDKNVMPGIFNLYKNTSGYVHLSNEHIFMQTDMVDNKERTTKTWIGKYDFFEIDEKVDFAYNMLVVTDLLYKLISSWTDQKREILS